jgi:DsbC/DsbD-like thiol-disulfide interchange protein
MIAQRKAGTIHNFSSSASLIAGGPVVSRKIRLRAGALMALTALAATAVAQERPAPISETRLIDGGFIDGARYAGLEIRLPGAAVTYWRNPGDAGAAPQFDFARSENVATAEPLYPAPERIDEEGVQTFGYRHAVMFPIRVTPREKDKAAILALSLDYAACEKLCLPVHADRLLVLPPQAGAPDPQITGALTRVPRSLDKAQALDFAQIRPIATPAGKKPQWLLRFAPGEARDIFIEAPPGFYIDTVRSGEAGAFLLTLTEYPAERPNLDAPVRVTVSAPAPKEFDLTLPRSTP